MKYILEYNRLLRVYEIYKYPEETFKGMLPECIKRISEEEFDQLMEILLKPY